MTNQNLKMNFNIFSKLKKTFLKKNIILAYLFGSEATGFKHKESDVDIAVLLDKKIKQHQYFKKTLEFPKLFEEIFPKRQIHILILNQATPLLKHQVLKEGRPIFWKNIEEMTKFNLEAVHLWEDTKPIREIEWTYLKKRIREGKFGEF